MANETEPRALSAALAAPAFVTRNHGAAMHAADRHVERWAPEATATRVRSMHALGFVDRLVAPWMETAQRSASLRLFQQYVVSGPAERPAGAVSWVFPRPWYQDELDWMAAARHSGGRSAASPSLLTTRGTYVAPAASSAASAPVAAPPVAMPAALYEYVAPALSIAASRPAPIAGVGFGGDAVSRGEAYSPLVSLAAVQAAELMTRTIAPLVAPRGVAAGMTADAGAAGRAMMTPGLRSVLTSILARAAASQDLPPTRLAGMAPELVTPPAPRGDSPVGPAGAGAARMSRGADEPAAASAMQVAAQYAAQQQRVAELQRVAQQVAQREAAARTEVAQQVAQREAAARAELARSQSAAAAAADTRAAAQARDAAAARGATQASEAAAAQVRVEAAARAAAQASETAAAQARGEAANRAAAQASETAAAQARDAGAARAAQAAAAQPAPGAETAELRAAAERAEAELRQQAAVGRGEVQRAADAPATTGAERAGATPTQTAAGRAEAQRQVEQASAAAAAERARIEERVAQRLTERTAAQRLHEQARAEAAAHVRAEAEQASRAAAPAAASAPAGAPGLAGPADTSSAVPTTPAEVTAAIAALPPDLAALLGSVIAQRPDRAMHAIHEINQALRTVELLARSSAAGAAFEPIRGPRLVMPAGLGGLVNAVDRAHAIAERPALLGGQRPLTPLPSPEWLAPEAGAGRAAAAAAREARVPTLTWLSAEPRSQSIAPTTALGATAAAAPAALSHVAWADRWLARFAGAAPQSLEMITAAGAADPAARMRALASAAPDAVFVAPDFLRGDVAADARPGRSGRLVDTAPTAAASTAAAIATAAAAAAAAPAATAPAAAAAPPSAPPGRTAAPVVETAAQRPAPPAEILRFDDAGETPDDVFTAIAAAASRGRAAARPSAPAPVAAPAAPPPAPAPAIAAPADRPVLADLVVHAAPSAPGAGLSAQLASSPFAAALRHVLTLPSAPSFDVRSLFGADLGLTYLAGLIGPASRELSIGAQAAPAWASWGEAALPLAAASDRPDRPDRIDRMVPGFDAAYVHPEEPARDTADLRAAARLTAGTGVSPSVAAAPAAAAPAAAAPATAAPATAPPSAAAPAAAAYAAPAPTVSATPTAAAELPSAARLGSLTTLRTALLSWELAVTGAPGATGAAQLVPAAFATAPSLVPATAASYRDAAMASAGAARRMVEAMSLPMVGESALERPATWTAPGMLAERAHSWSVAEERSASDLALDFVTPELVLAARVYGLGPAEAAQAARLAIAGPGHLGAMAGTVDRTFVEALAIGRDARLDAARQPRRAVERSEPDGAPRGIDSGAARDARGVPLALPVVAPALAPSAASATSSSAASATPAELVAQAAAAATAAAAAAAAPRATITTAFPMPGGEIAAAIAPMAGSAQAPSGTAFGVDRRTPRGAFLWPSATVAALGMSAAAPDGQLSMSVAALELLAAQVVAELGTYTALSDAHAASFGIAGDGEATASGRGALRGGAAARELLAPPASGEPAARAVPASDASRSPAALADAGRSPALADAGRSPAARAGRRDAAPAGAEPGEAEVLGAAVALVPASRRARFEALYVALGQSPSGIHWSPAARAARALALAGRGEDRPVTARERATAAWEVLPVVFGGDLGEPTVATTPAAAAGGAAGASASAAIAQAMASHVAPTWLSGPRPPATSGARGARRLAGAGPGDREVVAAEFGGAADLAQVHVTGPGLSGLASRAGEALGSYIVPAAPPAAPRERTSELTSVGAVLRPPTAAPEYVQTGGRSTGRYGGGEVEIPPWFEAAARKMLADRPGGDGISFAELTLVSSAPSSHIAASSRAAPSATPPAPSPAAAAQQTSNAAPQIDVEKLANEVYRNILVLMDVARARNGDPYS
ncbi:MAG TPA: hypothetical protein VHT91_44340 [Kofleriaceae bacterium]|nr:hypothetical protein [Kofleriaceae bacterium]